MDAGRLSATYDPFDQAQADDPFPAWEAALRQSPVFFSQRMGSWVVASHSLVSAVLSDNETFLSQGVDAKAPPPAEVQAIFDQLPPLAPALRAVDGADHSRRRKISQNALALRRVGQMEDAIRKIANNLIDRFEHAGECDFYSAFAYRFPLAVISKLLGFLDEDAERLHQWGNSRVALLWGDLDIEQHKAAARDVVAFHQFIEQEIESRIATPRDDLISDMIDLNNRAAAPISMAELIEQVHGLVTAGHETTANWLTIGLFHLLRRRALWERLCERNEEAAPLLEEALRFDGPVLGVFRIAGADTELNGVPIKRGERVYCAIGAANRDSAVFDAADALVTDRNNSRSAIPFGRGVHTCPGASIARMEARIAIQTTVQRLPGLRLAGASISFAPNASLRIPRELSVVWDVRSAK
jgi:cytochrome P450